MGDVEKGTVGQVWKNQEYNKFRKKVLGNRKAIGICNNCTEGRGRIYR
jgi:hypothetical protein